METSALTAADLREGFRSGDPRIDEFFRLYAGQNQFKHHVGVTFCAREAGEIVAFVTLAAGAVEPQELPDEMRARLPGYAAPVLRLARLGVDQRVRGQGIGTALLASATVIALEMRVRVGCVGIVVDAKPDARGFYERKGFRAMAVTSRMAGAGASPTRLFLNLSHALQSANHIGSVISPADSLAAEVRRRARELGLSAEEVRSAVNRMLGAP
jgi:GNAT superfamily N-acetyltransferase